MLFISLRKTIPLVALVCSAAVVAQAAQATIKHEPAPYTSPTKGSEMYAVYCAPCHGVAGKGDGPAAYSLKTPSPDLTKLAAKNNGKFPEAAVYNAIRGDVNAMPTAHGSKDMPVWGRIFQSISRDETDANLRLVNLVTYLKTLQK
jgi:mono/diheme cytochrome c family protein